MSEALSSSQNESNSNFTLPELLPLIMGFNWLNYSAQSAVTIWAEQEAFSLLRPIRGSS